MAASLTGIKSALGGILGALIEEAEEHGVQSVCLFTRIPDFFFKYGFRTVEDKSDLPDKIFKDCQSCPRLSRCDEVARGILSALKEVKTSIPMVVRLVGTNAEEGRQLLADAKMITAETLVDAAQKAVAAIKT